MTTGAESDIERTAAVLASRRHWDGGFDRFEDAHHQLMALDWLEARRYVERAEADVEAIAAEAAVNFQD